MKLWLVRHAKSSWADPDQADFDRPLNARGERDGPMMQEWLARQSDPATWIWTSNAARARATARFVQAGFAVPQEQVLEAAALYHATPEDILAVIRQTPVECTAVAVVGHNPGMTYTLNELTGRTVTTNVPTFGVGCLQVDCAWSELTAGACALDLFTSPKSLR